MTNRANLPPQAYTRDQLTAAYTWLQHQPEHIKRMAETTDALIAMYLQAKRGADSDEETMAPVSERTFKQSLINLKAEIEQFGDIPATSPAAIPPKMPLAQQEPARPLPPENSGAFVSASPKSQIRQTSVTQQAAPPLQYEESINITNLATSLTDSLDSRSRNMLRKVQDRFNLSSETEALRMLLVLGFEKAQSIFAKEF